MLALPPPYYMEAVESSFTRWHEEQHRQEDDSLRRFMTSVTPCGLLYRLLATLFGHSPYLTQLAIHHPRIIQRVVEQGVSSAWSDTVAEIDTLCPLTLDTKDLMRRLRRAKQHAALIIAIADITQIWHVHDVMHQWTQVADRLIHCVVQHLLSRLVERNLLLVSDVTMPQIGCGFCVLGLGKLGGQELNYSSDVDLIALYDEETVPILEQHADLSRIFVRLTKDLVRLLEERTEDGYVFRTDLRLRPDPRATPLAVSMAGAETYYGSFGQNWERAALIKARLVAGDPLVARRFTSFLHRFIWRRALDFAAIQDIHSIKRQIALHKGHHNITINGHDIKLGRGGIREIEFFVQTQQLIYGGRDPHQRAATTYDGLDSLAKGGYIDNTTATTLKHAYWLLRRIENHLQMIADQQTHRLPTEEGGIEALATFLGYRESACFRDQLLTTLRTVETHYAELFEESAVLSCSGNLVFTGTETDPETIQTLRRLGFENPLGISTTIAAWHRGRYRAMRSPRARELLTELIPSLLTALAKTPHPDVAFTNFDTFLGRLPAGVLLLSLFYTKRSLLELLADILGTAPDLALKLSHHPSLCDSLLSEDFFATFPHRTSLIETLQTMLVDARDFEDKLMLLRHWNNEHIFRAGVHILHHRSEVDDTLHYLSDVAEVVLEHLLSWVHDQFAETHGHLHGAEIVVCAMGNLGARHLSIGSDLDLIIIYDFPSEVTSSTGVKPLFPSEYFIRLSKRLITAMTAKTAQGALYEVDMRLRPSGTAGPLALHVNSFVDYQRKEAQNWEHMALTKARILGTPSSLATRLEKVIHGVLTARRDHKTLVTDIDAMRHRIHEHYATNNPWNIKYVRGGSVDIDFILHYLLLRHAHDHPEILSTDSNTAFHRLGARGLLAPEIVADLIETQRVWRGIKTYLRVLQGQDTVLPEQVPLGLVRGLVRIVFPTHTDAIDFTALESHVRQRQKRIYGYFHSIIKQEEA